MGTCTNAAHYDAQSGAVAVLDELTRDPRLHVADETACSPFFDEDGITIYHGDCREILPTLEADVLISDPDYGVNMDYGHEPLTGIEADALLMNALAEARIKSGHALIFWSGSWKRIEAFREAVAMTQWDIRHFGIWYKPNGAGASGNGLARRFETWFWLDQGIAKKDSEWSRLPDCISINRVHRGMDEASAHPSQKPEELMRRFVRFFSQPGDTILDPFMGSGTTLRAAKDLGRKAIGIELNEDYCNIARDRMRQAVLL